jgi:uncharacterized protein HemX
MHAWLGDLERTVKVRSRIGLVLAAIAIGAAGAGVYLGLTANDQSASNNDVSALRGELDKTKAIVAHQASTIQNLRGSLVTATSQADQASSTANKLNSQVKQLQTQVNSLQSAQTTAAGTTATTGTTGTSTTTTPTTPGTTGGGTGTGGTGK